MRFLLLWPGRDLPAHLRCAQAVEHRAAFRTPADADAEAQFLDRAPSLVLTVHAALFFLRASSNASIRSRAQPIRSNAASPAAVRFGRALRGFAGTGGAPWPGTSTPGCGGVGG